MFVIFLREEKGLQINYLNIIKENYNLKKDWNTLL